MGGELRSGYGSEGLFLVALGPAGRGVDLTISLTSEVNKWV